MARSPKELFERLRTYDLDLASSYASQAVAERLIERTLRRHSDDVDKWLSSPKGKLVLEDRSASQTGISAFASGELRPVHGVRVVLQRDSSMDEGFRILTSYPHP